MDFKNLGKYRTGGTVSHMQLSVPIPTTPDGRVYRFSPNEHAHPRHFVLGKTVKEIEPTPEMKARMKLSPRSKQTVCPYSGVVADDEAFTHPDDVKAATEIVSHAASADVEAELNRILGGFNRNQPRNSLLRIEAKLDHRPKIAPRFYRRDLLRELICDHCGRDYGVYAIGIYCPDCGAPNLRLHFSREAELVGTQVALAESQGEGSEELAYRLLGNAHEDVLTGFEATLKAVFLHRFAQDFLDKPPPNVTNDFQNVEKAQRHFARFGIDPFASLSTDELATLKLNIQKRHLIGHNLSVVDAKFAEHSTEARLGETIRLVGEDVRAFSRLAQVVVGALDNWIGGATAIPSAPAQIPEPPPMNKPMGDTVEEKARKLGISPLAFRLGNFLAARSENGFQDPINEEMVLAEFENEKSSALEEAIAELAREGCITTRDLFGTTLPRMRYQLELFATFDPLVLGNDPSADAAHLANVILSNEAQIDIPALHAETGWGLRRFNPALAVLATHVDPGRVLGGYDQQYPIRHIALVAADRVELRRLIERSGR